MESQITLFDLFGEGETLSSSSFPVSHDAHGGGFPQFLFEMDDVTSRPPVLPESSNWVPSAYFTLPDFDENVFPDKDIPPNASQIASYVADISYGPPMGGVFKLIRKVLTDSKPRNLLLLDCNAPAIVAIGRQCVPSGALFASYSDAQTAAYGFRLNGPVMSAPKDGTFDCIIRTASKDGENAEEVESLISRLNPGGILIAFVSALSFMDAVHSSITKPESSRCRVHSQAALIGCARFASNVHNHRTHVDLVAFVRRPAPSSSQCPFQRTGTGFMPWQKANEFYLARPGLILDTRGAFSSIAAVLLDPETGAC